MKIEFSTCCNHECGKLVKNHLKLRRKKKQVLLENEYYYLCGVGVQPTNGCPAYPGGQVH